MKKLRFRKQEKIEEQSPEIRKLDACIQCGGPCTYHAGCPICGKWEFCSYDCVIKHVEGRLFARSTEDLKWLETQITKEYVFTAQHGSGVNPGSKLMALIQLYRLLKEVRTRNQ